MIQSSSIGRSVDCWLRRHNKGILVHVNVVPEVEEFFKQWGGEGIEGPTGGRLWKPVNPEQPLKLWSFDTPLEGLENENYTMYNTGSALVLPNGSVNLSFLRLVGASTPEGREFLMENVVSADELFRIASKIMKAGERFYKSYIQNVNLNVYVGILDASRAGQ